MESAPTVAGGAASPTPRIRRNAYNKENAPMSQMTKRALVASLKDLLAEKPLDKIKIGRAHV